MIKDFKYKIFSNKKIDNLEDKAVGEITRQLHIIIDTMDSPQEETVGYFIGRLDINQIKNKLKTKETLTNHIHPKVIQTILIQIDRLEWDDCGCGYDKYGSFIKIIEE